MSEKRKFSRAGVAVSESKVCTSNHLAASEKDARDKRLDQSGVFGCHCAHDTILSCIFETFLFLICQVDMIKGEKFMYPDQGLKIVKEEILGTDTPVIMTYDVVCSYSAHVEVQLYSFCDYFLILNCRASMKLNLRM